MKEGEADEAINGGASKQPVKEEEELSTATSPGKSKERDSKGCLPSAIPLSLPPPPTPSLFPLYFCLSIKFQLNIF